MLQHKMSYIDTFIKSLGYLFDFGLIKKAKNVINRTL